MDLVSRYLDEGDFGAVARSVAHRRPLTPPLRVNAAVALACCGRWDDALALLDGCDGADVAAAVAHNRRIIGRLRGVDTTALPSRQIRAALFTFAPTERDTETEGGRGTAVSEGERLSRRTAAGLVREIRRLHEMGMGMGGDVGLESVRVVHGSVVLLGKCVQLTREGLELDVQAVVEVLVLLWPEAELEVRHRFRECDRLDEVVLELHPFTQVTKSDRGVLELWQAGRHRCVEGCVVRRAAVVEDVVKWVGGLSDEDALQPTALQLDDSVAVDGGFGGLTNEIMNIFFARAVPLLYSTGHSRDLCRAIAVMATRAALERRGFCAFLPQAHAITMIGKVPSIGHMFASLEYLDPDLASGLLKSVTQSEAWSSVYGNAIGSGFEWLRVKLTEVVMSRYATVTCKLKKVAEPFVSRLPPCVQDVLCDAVIHHPFVSAEQIVANLEFRDWNVDDSAPFFLCSWLHKANQSERRGFLRFSTGMTSIPPLGLPRRIVVFRSERLFAQTCFFQLEMPHYDNLSALEEAFRVAQDANDVFPSLSDE